MQTIDPIKPAPHPRRQTTPDGPVQGSVVRQNRPIVSRSDQTGARFTKLAQKKQPRYIPWDVIVPTLLSPLMVLCAMFGTVGWGVILLYAILALLFRLPSRVSFTLSLWALIYMVILQQTGGVKASQAIAGYIYILLVCGGLRLLSEVRRDSKMWFKKHH